MCRWKSKALTGCILMGMCRGFRPKAVSFTSFASTWATPSRRRRLFHPCRKRFVQAIEDFAKQQQVDVVTFGRHQRKDDVTKDYLARTSFTEGVLYIGKAQEKAAVFRTIHKRNAETGKSYPWISRGSALPNHYYFYLLDEDFGRYSSSFVPIFPMPLRSASTVMNGSNAN